MFGIIILIRKLEVILFHNAVHLINEFWKKKHYSSLIIYKLILIFLFIIQNIGCFIN